jgi:hypothetical protein
MPTDIWSIPKDPSGGGVLGSYFLRHKQTDTNAVIGMVQFENGRSTQPFTGQQLLAFVAAVGADVDLEPADDAARAALGVAAVAEAHVPNAPEAPPVAEKATAADEPEPLADTTEAASQSAVDLEPADDDIDAVEDVDALRAIAAGLYVDVDTRWKASRLRSEIRKARGH